MSPIPQLSSNIRSLVGIPLATPRWPQPCTHASPMPMHPARNGPAFAIALCGGGATACCVSLLPLSPPRHTCLPFATLGFLSSRANPRGAGPKRPAGTPTARRALTFSIQTPGPLRPIEIFSKNTRPNVVTKCLFGLTYSNPCTTLPAGGASHGRPRVARRA